MIFRKRKDTINSVLLAQRARSTREFTPSNSILSPAVATRHALVETRHGLIGTADLHLEEGSLVAIAAPGRALHSALLRVVPGARTAEDVLPLDALVQAAREDGLGDLVLEGAGAALEAVGPRVGQGHGEDVGAMGADWREWVGG